MTTAPMLARPSPPPPGRLLTLRALLAFILLDLAFRVVGLDRILERLRRRRHRPATWPAVAGREQAERTFAAVQRATMLYYRRRRDCLPKALTTFHLLRRQGLAAELCIGVKKFPFAAHSWVEAYGQLLDDEPTRLASYTVIHRVGA